MLRWPDYINGAIRTLLRNLPVSDYVKTRIWATSLLRVEPRVKDWPYYRCIELAMRKMWMDENKPYQGGFFPARGNKFSMLEFGVANGSSFVMLLHFRDVWSRRLGVKSEVIGVGFDTFEGLPEAQPEDFAIPWKRGDYPGDMQQLQQYLEKRFKNFRLVKGLFSETLQTSRQLLQEYPPVFVVIDCDYYSSTMDVLRVLLPDLAPHGCLFYFDDVYTNFGSDRTGELRAIAEVNAGKFGGHIQLVEYPLWIETRDIRHYKEVYRLVNLETADEQPRSAPPRAPEELPGVGEKGLWQRISPL